MSQIMVMCRECGEEVFEFYVEDADPSVGFDSVGFSPEFDVDAPCACGALPPTQDDAARVYEDQCQDAADDAAERRVDAWRDA